MCSALICGAVNTVLVLKSELWVFNRDYKLEIQYCSAVLFLLPVSYALITAPFSWHTVPNLNVLCFGASNFSPHS